MSVTPAPDCLTSLDAVLADIWPRLLHGKADRRAPLHTLAIGTIGMDGQPEQRIMVVRAVDPDVRALRFHTDSRSAKAMALSLHGAVSILGYDPQAKVQLRLNGTGYIHRDDTVADAAWAASTLSSRRCYLATPGPGTPITEPSAGLPEALKLRVPTAAETQDGRANFAVLRVEVNEIDWLYLAAAGHRRARFVWQSGVWQGRWLIP